MTQPRAMNYVRIFTEKTVNQFLIKYMTCKSYPQNLIIISPFISDLGGETYSLKEIVNKITQDKTPTYVVTRKPIERYQQEGISVLKDSPFTEIRYNDSIHAKLYICWCRKNEDDSFALFGSGNLTSGGVRQNLELGMMIYSHDHGRKIIRDLYYWSINQLRTQSKREKSISYKRTGGK